MALDADPGGGGGWAGWLGAYDRAGELPAVRPGDTLRLGGDTSTVAGLDSASVRLIDVTGAVPDWRRSWLVRPGVVRRCGLV